MFFSYESYVLMSSPFREIITLVFSSDAARNVPTPPHYSLLTTQKYVSSVLLSKDLTTHHSQLITQKLLISKFFRTFVQNTQAT